MRSDGQDPSRSEHKIGPRQITQPSPWHAPSIAGICGLTRSTCRSLMRLCGNTPKPWVSTAQHWAERQADPAESTSYYDSDTIDDTNWTQASLAKRAAHLAKRRSDNPESARALLEAAWPQENADAPFRLLQAMEIGLADADRSFLESLEKDRAPRVRQLSRRLLRKLGVGGENPAYGCAGSRDNPRKRLPCRRCPLSLDR